MDAKRQMVITSPLVAARYVASLLDLCLSFTKQKTKHGPTTSNSEGVQKAMFVSELAADWTGGCGIIR